MTASITNILSDVSVTVTNIPSDVTVTVFFSESMKTLVHDVLSADWHPRSGEAWDLKKRGLRYK